MGIPGIYKQIGPGERVALAKLAVDHLEETGRSLRIAIDISIWQFQIQAGQGGKNPALRTLYYRLLKLLGLSIQPLFVFDGPHKPQFKRGKKVGSNLACLPNFLTKELLKRFGFPYHTAPGEAEAECALLQKEGIVDAVLGEDVDTLMFGCSMSLRSWTAEGTRGSKSPTHVSMYRSETVQTTSGFDNQGMILVALMSGGDYTPAGIPGCGIRTACEAAKAGFGRDLCKFQRKDIIDMKKWRDDLQHELRTNERKLFRQKHKTLNIPESFPDMTVLGYYVRPVVSSSQRITELRNDIKWNSSVDVAGLRMFVTDAFDWQYLSGAKKFIRGLAPALLANSLISRSDATIKGNGTVESAELEEAKLVKVICGKRTHWNTGTVPELRLAYVPNDITGLDLDAEEADYYASLQELSDDDQQASEGEDQPRSCSPTKRRGVSSYDPTQIEKIWMLETYAKLGVPLLVETWEEDMRNPKKFASRKARERSRVKEAKTKPGAMDQYFKISKPGIQKNCNKPIRSREDKQNTRPPPAPQVSTAVVNNSSLYSNALLELPNPTEQKIEKKRVPIHRAGKHTTNKAPKVKSSSPMSNKDTATNPWTLARRPSDTLGVKSPSRYSALGFFTPDYGENHIETLGGNPPIHNTSQPPPLPPISPTPKRIRSRPTTPNPNPEQDQCAHLSIHNLSLNSPPTTKKPSIPTPQALEKPSPSPRKKRSPLQTANPPSSTDNKKLQTPISKYLNKQLRTPPVHLHQEEDSSEALTSKNVNRKLDFSAGKSSPPQPQQHKIASSSSSSSPASDTSSLPSPSTIISPPTIPAKTSSISETAATSPPMRTTLSTPARDGKDRRRLIALRESLDGAWKYVQPWETELRLAKGVFRDVEVLDLSGE